MLDGRMEAKCEGRPCERHIKMPALGLISACLPATLGADIVLRLGADGRQLVFGVLEPVGVCCRQRGAYNKGAGAGKARALPLRGWGSTG
jgi:hypothetical protein